jgi:hypothetical protein
MNQVHLFLTEVYNFLIVCLDYFSALKMETARSSEKPVNFSWHHILDDSTHEVMEVFQVILPKLCMHFSEIQAYTRQH